MMRRLTLLVGALFALVTLSTPAAFAATIGFAPSLQSVNLGDPVSVDVVISNLGGEIVSAYDLDVTYDPSILLVTSVTFGTLLGDESLFQAFNDFDLSTAGVVDFAQLSLLSDASLLALQGGDSFTLATLDFGTVGAGVSSLDFVFDAFNDLKGLNAQQLDVTAIAGGVSVVPEPGAATIFAVGGVIVAVAVRRGRGRW